MDICIRSMLPEEALAVCKLGLITFHSMEGCFMGKPKNAIVALDGEKIVGAVTYKIYRYGEKKLGYLDYAFVDRHYHGQGIGTKLYGATVSKLKELGCEQISGLVRGDNPASFLLFEKQKAYRCSCPEMKRVLGISGTLKVLLSTPYGWGPASDLYLSGAKPKKDGKQQILWYLLANLILIPLGAWKFGNGLLYIMLAGLSVLGLEVLTGAVVCLRERGTYHFRLSMNGCYITILAMLMGGFFPLTGKWYPEKFAPTEKQKSNLCFGAVLSWISNLAVCIISKLWLPESTYTKFLYYFSYSMIIYNMIPTYPFSEYHARRVFQYRKWLYIVLWLASAAILYLIDK